MGQGGHRHQLGGSLEDENSQELHDATMQFYMLQAGFQSK